MTETLAKRKPNELRELLEGAEFRTQLARALPNAMSPERFVRITATSTMRNPKLLLCSRDSFFRCLLDLSAMGLEPDGRQAHLIPRKNKQGILECTLNVDYKGLKELLYRNGDIIDEHSDVVGDLDLFEYEYGTNKHLRHVPNTRDRGKIYCAYSFITLPKGGTTFDVISTDQIEAIRKRSPAGNEGPWVTDWSEMAKKGLALNTPIPTPDGWTTMDQINVGDRVFDLNGTITKVIAVSEIKNLDCFKVAFAGGDSIICDDEHRWLATIGNNRQKQKKEHGWPTHTVNDLFIAKTKKRIISIPVNQVLQTPEKNLPIDPWLLGYWLGDGNAIHAKLSSDAQDVPEIIERIKRSKYSVGKVSKDGFGNAVAIGIKDGFLVDLRECGLLGNKHVPSIYLRASSQQRYELLCGLMDSDGHVEKSRGRAMFGNTSKCLRDAVVELATSLGQVVNFQTSKATGFGKTVIVYIASWQPSMAPVSLSRKLGRFRERKLPLYRGVKSIERVPSVPTRCIAVDSPTHTYLAGASMAPTHNTVFRRLSKGLPLSPKSRDAIETDLTYDIQEPAAASEPTRAVIGGRKARELPPEPDEIPIEDPAPVHEHESKEPVETPNSQSEPVSGKSKPNTAPGPLTRLREALEAAKFAPDELVRVLKEVRLVNQKMEGIDQVPARVLEEVLSDWENVVIRLKAERERIAKAAEEFPQ